MKNLKKLSVAVMLAALFSTSFTSCIDGEVSPVVEAIYAAQADLLAAQAAVQEAEAELLAAQAAAEEAQAALLLAQAEAAADVAEGQLAVLMAQANLTQAEADMLAAEAQALADLTAAEVVQMLADADYTAAETAYLMAQAQALADLTAAEVAQMMAQAGYTEAQTAAIMAETAAMEAMWAEKLATMIEMNDIAVAEAQAELMMAQEKFEAYMAEVMLDLIEAGADLAEELADEYDSAMAWVNSLKMQKNVKEGALANKEIMLALGEYAPGMYLAHLEAELAALQQSGVDAQTTIDELNAYLANPSAEDAQVLGLQAANADLVDANKAIDIAVAELNVTINEINAEMTANGDLTSYYTTHKNFRDAQQGLQDALTAANTAMMAANATWQAAVDGYDATTTSLTTARTNALAIHDAQLPVVSAALATYNADKALSDEAAADLVTLQNTINSLEGTLNAAAATLAAEQATYDAGIGAATTAASNAATNVTNRSNAVDAAWVVYQTWRDRFEGGPTTNGGFYWEDTTSPSVQLGDDVLGLQTDDTNVAVVSYVRVETWVNAGVDDNQAATISGTVVGALPVGANVYGFIALTDAQVATAYPAVAGTEWYIEVGLDDEFSDNLAEFQAATTALGNEDIMDVMPMYDGPGGAADSSPYSAGFTYTGDAYENYWDSLLEQMELDYALANFGNALAAAQLAYDELKAVYEDELNLLQTAQGLASSTAATTAASLSTYNSENAYLTTLLNNFLAADSALSTHLATTKAQYQSWIDANDETIAANDIYIAEYQILIDQAQADMDAVQDEIDALALTPLMAQLIADKHAAMDMIAAYMAEKSMNMATYANNNSIIAVIGTGSLDAWQIAMDAANATLAALPGQIHVKEVQILFAGFDLDALEADIANCEEEIADLEAMIAAAEDYAAGVWALLQDALAS